MGNRTHKIQPRSLSDKELVRYYALLLDEAGEVPVNWQAELLRRFLSRLEDPQQ
jgi:hypothetical protein